MPCKIKVKVLAGRNLPVMDRAGDTTDAFVEIKFGGVTHKTDVCRKSLNPHWNSTEWYRFEVDESELQDEPLQLRLMDHDTYSANDAIGKVVISLAPLLAKEAKSEKGQQRNGAVMSGWIPVFDTMHGIRGELNVIVKVELFSDFNKYKTSSCGVQFFHCPSIPPGYRATAIHGFVEELVVNDDPEYQWIDKIRTPRASNEARQVAFIKLSNQVQRLVGLKAAELGANAVVGYQQDFDLEGEAGVVARAIGTAVNIVPLPTQTQPVSAPPCSQQQLKKYLDILATGDETVTDLNQYFQHHQDELAKFLNILHPKLSSNFLDETETNEEDDVRSINLTRQSSMKSYTDSVSLFQDDYASHKSLRTISEDQSDLNRLLSRNDENNDTEKPGPLRKIKKIKKNFFSKRLAGIRLRRTEKINEDRVSLKSTSSDVQSLPIVEVLKRVPTPKFKKPFVNDEEEGTGMASILARSILHAHTSLACISETQAEASASAEGRRKTSESEPVINVIKEDTETPESEESPVEGTGKPKDFRFTSLKNINSDAKSPVPQRKLSESCPNTPVISRSENLLKLPGEIGSFGSISSALSGESSEVYSSSEEDDESSDQRTDTDRSFETTSSVVQNVLSQKIDPKIITHMDRKLSVLESSTPEPSETRSYKERKDSSEEKSPERENNNNEKIEEGLSNQEPSTSTQSPQTFVKEKPTLHFKFHNPFSHKASLSAPSSPVEKKSIVYRSSNKIKRQWSKISKSSIIKSVSHISLIPKKKNSKPLSRPASSSDIQSTSKTINKDTVLGSSFLSYSDLLNLDKDEAFDKKIKKDDVHKDETNSKVEMYIGSEPMSRASVSGPSSPYSLKDEHVHELKEKRKNSGIKPTGLLHTAMETILIDKVQSLLIPTSPEPNSVEKQFFKDVNLKLEQVETDRKNESARKLVRQDSIHSAESEPSLKMSEDKHKPKPSLLQHFHPIMSGPKVLETIPSLPESSSVDRAQSLDVEGVDSCETNSVNNKHAVCGATVDRMERERERDRCDKDKGSPRHARHESYSAKDPPNGSVSAQNSSLNASSPPVGMHRRSSDSDLSITPKGGSLNASLGNTGSGGGAILRPSMNSNNIDMLEYPFLTMTEFPPGFIVQIGGCVSARSVKLVEGEGCASVRAAWWAELRTEMRSHCRAARCHAVLGYSESAALCEEVCVLSASGTAAVINLDCDFSVDPDNYINVQNVTNSIPKATLEEFDECCSLAHVPYSTDGAYKAELSSCPRCRRAKVPAVLLATCAKPPKLLSYGKSVPITACAARLRRAPPSSEPGARDISDQLPFLEYELHKLLVAKLRMQGANAMFELRTSIGIGERCVCCVTRGAAVRLAALPAPTTPQVKALENHKEALEIQKALLHTFTANRAANGYDIAPLEAHGAGVPGGGGGGGGEEPPALELAGDKDAVVLELDEADDVETARSLAKTMRTMQVFTNNLRATPHMPPQAFMQVWRARLGLSQSGCGAAAERHVTRAIQGALYKLRRLQPCALVTPTIQVDLPEDEIQIVLSGTAIPLQENAKADLASAKGTGDTDDAIFTLDEEQNCAESAIETTTSQPSSRVILTSLKYVCGVKCERRICAFRSLFVRETTTVRELGGMSGFLHTFTSEVLAIVRAYTAALGGNALTSFYITQLMLQDNAHKNQGQCLLSVGGDVVHVTY